MYSQVNINYKKIDPKAIMPTKGSKYSAGVDLYAVCKRVSGMQILPRNTVKIKTGIAIEIPEGYFGAIFARSGMATNKGLRPANCVGVIDSDYRGEIIVPLYNDSDECRTIRSGDRVAQLVVLPFLNMEMNEVEELSDTERGDGGFGSTGN